jgi:hypothetical protein
MPLTPTTIYSNCTPTLSPGCILYTNTGLTITVSNGYYSDGFYIYRVTGGAGVILTKTACPAPTPSPTSTGCLVKGTIITMEDGSTKFIEDVQKDDVILSIKNTKEFFETNQFITIGAKVIDNIVHLNEKIYDINNGLLVSSESHNHVIKRDGGWLIKKTNELMINDIMKDTNNNEIKITSVDLLEDSTPVHNIIVSDESIYFANGILTHNKFNLCCEVSPGVCQSASGVSCAALGYGDCPGLC